MSTPEGTRPAPTGWRLWLAGARPRTLPAAVVPVLVGTAAAVGDGVGGLREVVVAGSAQVDTVLSTEPALGGIVIWRALAAMVVALAIQVGTNYANDYSDGKRGTDAEDRVGPLRLVGSGLATAGSVKRAAFASFGVAAVAGFALALAVSLWLIPVGLVCFAAGWLYTGGPRPYGYAGLGEVFVFVFFGVVATAGSTFVQIEAMPWLGLACSIPVGCLATALLVVNNLRDIPSDTRAGKRTLAVKLGDRRTRFLYVALMVLPYVSLFLIPGLAGRPFAAAALFTVVLARVPVHRVLEGATGPALIPVLGKTGQVQLAFGVVFAAGLCIVP